MMMKENLEQEPFQVRLEKLYQGIGPEDPLHKIRTKAWDRFLELGLPSRHNEAFGYIRLRQLYAEPWTASPSASVSQEQIASFVYPECKGSVLVFINGRFNLQLSNLAALGKRTIVCTLAEASQSYGAFLNHRLGKTLMEETDAFASLNTVLHPLGAFLYLPPKTIVDVPVQILHVTDLDEEQMLVMPRLHVFLGAQSQLEMVSSHGLIKGRHYFFNQVVDFAIEEDSHLKYTQTVFSPMADMWHFDATRATLKRNSTMKKVCVTDGSLTVRHDERVALIGENAEAQLNGMAMLSNKCEAHSHVVIDHQAPHCRSMQLYKNVLNDTARSSFEGKILVRQLAQKTGAYQLNNNLLLSDKSHADSKPNLEIFADDVKASHGSTIGSLDPDQLFYIKSRGMTHRFAQNLLVYGFCKEVIDLITLPSVLKEMNQKAEGYLK